MIGRMIMNAYLVSPQAGIGIVMASIHRSLVNDDSGEVVNVLRGVYALFVFFDGIWEHVEGYREVDMSFHLLGRGRGMLVALASILVQLKMANVSEGIWPTNL
jgi:hypothetical protein